MWQFQVATLYSFLKLILIFHKIDQKASEGIRYYIKFAFHHFSKYSSKIKILCENLYKSRLEDSVSIFVFPIGLLKVETSWISRKGEILDPTFPPPHLTSYERKC